MLPPDLIAFDHIEMGKETGSLTVRLWPNFIIEPSDVEEESFQFTLSRAELKRRFPSWGIRRASDNRLVAHASAVLTDIDPWAARLPEDGWRAAMRGCGASDVKSFCLLAANVDPEFRSLGLSQALLSMGKEIAVKLGFNAMIGPVRPTLKSEYPQLAMSDFLALKSDEGSILDPWLRTHAAQGAEILNFCSSSVLIRASVPKWETWTKMQFEKSGRYVVPRALDTVEIDLGKNLGTYTEPNVWVRYRLD